MKYCLGLLSKNEKISSTVRLGKFPKLPKSKIIASSIFFLFIQLSLFAQDRVTKEFNLSIAIANNLEQEGFQSIDIRQVEQGLVIAYENRIYRFDALGMEQVIEITKSTLNEQLHLFENLTFVSKRHNIPELSAIWNVVDSRTNDLSSISFSREVDAMNKGRSLIKNQNTGNFRVELVLRPFLTMELGNLYLEDQFIHLIDLRPKLNIYLWKGAHFTSEIILPISNEFKTQAPQWGMIRTRVISFTQQFRLPKTTFLNTSIGLFSRNRYGVSAQVGKYLLKDRLLLTGRIGYTGHASYVRFNGIEVQKKWLYTKLNYLDYKVGAQYWLPKWNTQVSVEYGKVLFDRKALFFKCTQMFKEVELGFFLFRTDQGRNYGMDISIPIFPKKYWKPKLLTVRPTKKFHYRYLSGFDQSGQVNVAREYQAQGMYGDFLQDLNPYFLKNYVLNNIN